ncbi:hypothetical protein [Jiella avicenniae]|uniref:Uncharacterized protein n=1 Tax=Jiella avicenniae TaxID=2907202 RepID=A0A9X1T460_9HYPH|nr:hypothetical protein [Jiella avicenniae]MCE7028271.1 hypothetical protein [Jiella avicenniae]
MSRTIFAMLLSAALVCHTQARPAAGPEMEKNPPSDASATGAGEAPERDLILAAGPASSSPAGPPRQTRKPAGALGADGYRLLARIGAEGGPDGTSAGVVVLELPRPAPNPGPQRDIDVRKLASGPDLESVIATVPAIGPYDRTLGEPCRIDWIDRCAWMPETLADGLYDSLREAGVEPSRHEEPYFYVSRFGPADRMIISRTARFGDGSLSLVNAVADRDGTIQKLFTIPVSRDVQGFEAGEAAATVAVLSASEGEDGAIYLTIDTPSRCGDRARRAGLLVKTDAEFSAVDWVSPFNVSDTNVAIRGGRIYAASGGSCEKDYLYELDAATGRVTARNVLPTAADFLVGAGDHLLIDLYEGAEAYGFR